MQEVRGGTESRGQCGCGCEERHALCCDSGLQPDTCKSLHPGRQGRRTCVCTCCIALDTCSLVVGRHGLPLEAVSWEQLAPTNTSLMVSLFVPLAGTQQQQQLLPRYTSELQQPCGLSADQLAAVQCAPDVDPSVVSSLLEPLQGRRLNYTAFARDTQQGKDCECTLLLARASLVWLPQPGSQPGSHTHDTDQLPPAVLQQHQQEQHQQQGLPGGSGGGDDGWPCLAVELVADRFLRRMVRVLVGTLVREAVAVAQAGGAGGREQLLQLAESMDRRATAAAAPALGLCFAAVGYEAADDEPGGL